MISTVYLNSRECGNKSTLQFQAQNLYSIGSTEKYAIDVSTVTFPKVVPNVNARNNRPWISVNGAAATQVSVANALPITNYTGATLAAAVATMLSAHVGGTAITVSYDSSRFTCSLTTGSNTVRFAPATEGYGITYNITQRFLDIIGWRNYAEVTLAAGTTFPTISAGVTTFNNEVVKLNGTDYVDLCANFTTFCYSTSPSNPQILLRINTPNAIGTIISFDEAFLQTVTICSGQMLSNATFFLRNEYRDVVEIPSNYAFNIVLNLSEVN